MSEIACPYCKSIGEHACNCFDPVPRTWKEIRPGMVTVFADDHAKLVSEITRLRQRIAELEAENERQRDNYAACVTVHHMEGAQKRYEELVKKTPSGARIAELEETIRTIRKATIAANVALHPDTEGGGGPCGYDGITGGTGGTAGGPNTTKGGENG